MRDPGGARAALAALLLLLGGAQGGEATFSVIATDLETRRTGCAAVSCIGSRSIDVVCGAGGEGGVVAAQALLGEQTSFPCFVSVPLPRDACARARSNGAYTNPQVFRVSNDGGGGGNGDDATSYTCHVSCCTLQFLNLPPGERRRTREREFSQLFDASADASSYFSWASTAWRRCNSATEGVPPSAARLYSTSTESSNTQGASDWPLRDALANALAAGNAPEVAVQSIVAPGQDYLWGGAESRQYSACDLGGCSSFQGRSCWANPRCDNCLTDTQEEEEGGLGVDGSRFSVAARTDLRDPLALHLAGYDLLSPEPDVQQHGSEQQREDAPLPLYTMRPLANSRGVRRCWPDVFAGAVHGAVVNDTPVRRAATSYTTGGVGTTEFQWEGREHPDDGRNATTTSLTTHTLWLGGKPRYIFSVQGNTLTSQRVLENAADAFAKPVSPAVQRQGGTCEMAHRLLTALQEGAGRSPLVTEGDARCVVDRGVPGNSASLRVTGSSSAPALRFDAAFPPHAARADALGSLARAVEGWAEVSCGGDLDPLDALEAGAVRAASVPASPSAADALSGVLSFWGGLVDAAAQALQG